MKASMCSGERSDFVASLEEVEVGGGEGVAESEFGVGDEGGIRY